MGLSDYKQKRNFKNTPEPGAENSQENSYRFVIQRHDATRLHYDLRLEMEGVLKSWAVPKGPSMNPNDKRLAINTEDHPVKYLFFEGTIPKGNYGAGEMNIWDTGTYKISESSSEKDPVRHYKRGNMKITFQGEKIKGDFALVHTQNGKEKNQWLLIKKKDQFSTDLGYDAEVFSAHRSKNSSTSISVSDFVPPMLATATKKIFNDPNWIYELKWDGYRMLSNIESGNVKLFSRKGISFNKKFSEILTDLEQIPYDVILDGEVVVLGKNGKPQFQALQNYGSNTSGDLRYYVFDLLYLNGHSTMQLSVVERKSLLPDILEGLEKTIYCDHIEGMGTAFYKKAIDQGMEGVIAKKADSEYSPGYRSEKWLKIKTVESQEAILCGYTDSKTGGSPFGSLILGMHKEGELVYIGNCGSGFSASEKKELLKKLKALETDENPFDENPELKGRKPYWVKPELIGEVKFSEWTKGGHLRHPVFKGLREDKNTQEIKKEKKVAAPVASSSSSSLLEVGGIQVPISNLEKVYWPDSGLRKYDLIDYYLKVSETMMPYLKDRPQNLHRHPNGINSDGFFQKDNEDLPDWVETAEIHSTSSKKVINYLVCQNEATLLYMANLGCIEINPWNSRLQHLDNPTYTVIDLDPSENNTFEEVITVAQAAKEVLDMAGIEGYCKTSGSSGLHIYIPLNEEYTFDEARDFTKLLCYYVREMTSEITTLERNLRKRGKDKIYLDYLQNRRGQTLAAPYCVRPKKGATVSAPLFWKEVKSGLKIADFNIETMPERIQEISDIFTPVLEKGINMEAALEKLNQG